MSYDLSLRRENPAIRLLSQTDLEELPNKFRVRDVVSNSDGGVRAFILMPDPEDEGGYMFDYQDESGSYSTSLSYGANKNYIEELLEVIETLATRFDLLIEDPQIKQGWMSPSEYRVEQEQVKRVYIKTRNLTKDVLPKLMGIAPLARSKYFIMYLILAADPETGETLFLAEERGVYCSKVLPGEALDEVIEREIPLLTGSNEYTVLDVVEGDPTPDKRGNELPRVNLHIQVPYFDPSTRDLEIPMKWHPLP